MKKHILKSILFLIGLLVLIQCLVIRNNPYLKNKVDYEATIANAEQYNAPYLIVGDSHAGMIKQSMLNNDVYNIATASDSMNEIYIKIAHTIKHNPNFKYLLLTADYHILSKYRDAFNNKPYIKPFSSPEDYQLIYNESYHNNFISDTLSQHPLFDYNVYVTARMRLIGKIKNTLKGKKFRESKNKQWIEHPPEERIKRAKERAKIHLTRIMTDNNAKRYQDIIELCKKNNIKVIGLRYPLSKEYRDQMINYDLSPIAIFYQSIHFDSFLDYSRLTDDVQYFNDMDHLNNHGVKLFLKSLYKDLTSIH